MRRTEQEKGWRDNWFAKNWLGALPMLRAIRAQTKSEALDALAGDVMMLGGGAIGMWLEMWLVPMKHDNSGEKTLLMLPGMWLGMGTGNVIYKSGKSLLCAAEPSAERVPLVQP